MAHIGDVYFLASSLHRRSKEDGAALSAILAIVLKIATKQSVSDDEIDIIQELRKDLENRI